MINNPTIVATKADLAAMASQAQVAALEAEIQALSAALSDMIENPPAPPVDTSWLSSWIGASGTLPGSINNNSSSQIGAWSVTSDQSLTTQTASGSSMCSSTQGTQNSKGNPSDANGYYCWCKLTSPRAGAWVLRNNLTPASSCAVNCAYECAYGIKQTPDFRAVVLSE